MAMMMMDKIGMVSIDMVTIKTVLMNTVGLKKIIGNNKRWL
jgi:hypothetical protein